ncbi:hypothetical protein, partial [Lacticaseibacillus paracasei]|uniref:hypothetical protein n=1 Tax=Lacticaseibacillus paracasei TaxID=1597 RepID=UPI00325C6BAE
IQMKLKSFIPFCLTILMGIQVAFYHFKLHFTDGAAVNQVLLKTREELEKEKLKSSLAYYELESLKQQVATILPSEVIHKEYS